MAKKPDKNNMPAQQKDIKDLVKRVNKFEDNLNAIDKSFSNMSVEFKEYVNNVGDISLGMSDFLDLQKDSLAGFGKDLTGSMKETLKWSERLQYDINSITDTNIRNMNAGIASMDEMKSETGKMMEQRVGALMEKLRKADHSEAVEIIAQLHAMREESFATLEEEEAKRIEFMTATATHGLEKIDTFGTMLTQSIAESLPSLDKFAENILGGGILGKVAGGLIRKRKAKKTAEQQAKMISAQGGQVDQARQAGLDAAANRAEGVPMLAAFTQGQDAMIASLQEQNYYFRELLDLQDVQTESILDAKEEDAEAAREAERRHDESLRAGKGGKIVAGGEKKKGILGTIVSAIGGGLMAALQGQWIAKAASFILSPLKAVVSLASSGISKAVGFIMPKKWTAGISKFFKSTDTQQKTIMKSSKKTGGFLTKLIDTIKNVFKGIIDIIKTIFKTVMDVITSIAKGIGDVMKEIARGIGYFGKKNVLLGAIALGIVAGSIFVFAKAMVEFTKVNWKAVGVAAVSILLLVGTLAALGALMMTGVGAVALLLGAVALLVVAGAMWVLGKAMQEFAKAADIAIPAIEVIGELMIRFAKIVAKPFLKIAEVIMTVVTKLGDVVIKILDTVGKVFTTFIQSMVPIIDSIADLIVRPIEAVGDVIVGIVTAIGDAVTKVITGTADTFERFGSAGLAAGIGKTALAIGGLSLAIVAFAAAEAGGKILGAVGNIIGGFLSLFGGGDPPTALEIIAALSTMDPGSLEKVPKLIDNISKSLRRFGGITVDTDGAENAIYILAEIADELGEEDRLTAFSRLSRINMQSFADGMMSLLEVGKDVHKSDAASVWGWLGEIMGIGGHLVDPDKLGKQARAINVFAQALSNLAKSVVELNQATNPLAQNQQMNISLSAEGRMNELAMAGGPAPNMVSNTNSVVKNSQHFSLPINSRNEDNTLNAIATSRR